MRQRFFMCKRCGSIITVVNNKGNSTFCCGEKMTELIPNSTKADPQKHIPIYNVNDGKIHVKVGCVEHPMIPEHYIEWIAVQTKRGCQIRYLHPGDKPEACFCICDCDEIEAVYAYCNIHGLWCK